MTQYVDRVRIARQIMDIKTDTGGFLKALSAALGIPWVNDGGNQSRLYKIKYTLSKLIQDQSFGTNAIDNVMSSVNNAIKLAGREENLSNFTRALRIALGMEEDTGHLYIDDLTEAVTEVATRVRDAAVGSMLFPPMSRDNKNIYLGDTVYDDKGRPHTIRTIIAKAGGETMVCDGIIDACTASSAKAYTKGKPRTLQDVENDAVGAVAANNKERARELISEAYRMGKEA